jgi:hemolysin activation/secretion protein
MQCLPIAGFLIQPSCGIRCKRTDDKQGVLQVTPFVDFGNVWNPRESAVLEANTLLSAGLRLR